MQYVHHKRFIILSIGHRQPEQTVSRGNLPNPVPPTGNSLGPNREREASLSRSGSILREIRSSYVARKLGELASRFEVQKWRDQIHAGELGEDFVCDFLRDL